MAGVLEHIRGTFPAVNVLFEFGRPGINYGQPAVMTFRLMDILHHTRLQNVGEVMTCLEMINAALAEVKQDPSVRFCGFDNEGHCLIAPQAQASIATLWQGMMARRHGTLVMMSSIAGRKVYPDHTVYCGTKFFVHGVSESLREYLSGYDVRVLVVSPGIIETEVLDGVRDPDTLANYKANKAAIGGGIGAEHVAKLILDAYQLPQNALVQEICITPTRQKY